MPDVVYVVEERLDHGALRHGAAVARSRHALEEHGRQSEANIASAIPLGILSIGDA
jgi:hypothetical protein